MYRCFLGVIFLSCTWLSLCGQSNDSYPPAASSNSAVGSSLPVVMKFSGTVQEFGSSLLPSVRDMTFALYKDQTGGEALWTESQTVSIDNQGRFAVLLGSASTDGIPPSVFASAGPRWVSLMMDDGGEHPRVELSSVPYAFKAADADTLGGKNSNEFVTQQQLNSLLPKWPAPIPPPLPVVSLPVARVAPRFEATAETGPSFVSDATIGPPFRVNSPELVPRLNVDLLHGLSDSAFAKLSENNTFLSLQTLAGGIDMPASNLEPNTSSIFDSAPLDFDSSYPGSQPNTPLTQRFSWISQPLPPTTTGPTAHLGLFFGANGATPSSTGLFFNSDGTINFAAGQQLPPAAVLAAIAGATNQGTGLGPAGPNNPFVDTSNYVWVQEPPKAVAIQVGQNIVTLTPCPRGVNGADAWHYLYVSGTGTPEVVLITGGTCTSGAKSGTIEFTANYVHPPGYSIGSASDGIQEAFISADVIQTAGKISRQVIITPGAHLLRARVSVRSSSMTITSSGATLTCAMSDTCLMLGDPTNANTFQSIVLQGLRLAPGVVGGTWPAVEDNAQGSQINDLGPATSPVSGASFGSLVQIDNDQAAVLNGISTTYNYAWGRCDTTFCSSAILGPGPYSKNAGVLWVQNSNLSLQCGGNAIDNQDGNTLQVINSIVQGYAQFGIRASTAYRSTTVSLSNVYEEEDGYCNPLGTGSSGLIVEGGHATSSSSPSAGLLPLFANNGQTQYYYYVVVHSSTFGISPVYIAGFAYTGGSGEIQVLWNQVGTEGVITYDVLRISGNGGPQMAAPYGTGLFAIATNVPASLCANKICSVIDNAGSTPISYTVAGNTNYWPSLKLWPGTVILTTPYDIQNSGGGNPTMYFTDQLPAGAIVNSAGGTYASVFAQECEQQGNWTAIWEQCLGGNSVGNDWPAVTATLLQESGTGSAAGGLKGRMIFELPPGASVAHPTHVITLSDSNPDKTLATPGNRPAFDPNDGYIGYDGVAYAAKTPISLGSPVSISRYIGNDGDGVSYLERLTATMEQYRVPVSLVAVPFASLPIMPDGTVLYCSDCQNIHDDGVEFDSDAEAGGHGTNLLHENGQWRVH